ncbi:MAG: Fe(2+) transporter FeoB [Planctomycetes bacterium]|nr:Fe(2+) transporter FeoB [Planctomycetota bacterium]
MTAPGTRSSLVSLGSVARRPQRVALAGNPNVGKSSLFNALTGMRQKVSNYPGTTVERRTGTMEAPGGAIQVVDLPGTYSLLPRSPDEQVVRDELSGRGPDGAAPDVVAIVVDATNVERNLFLALQIFETGIPCVVALNQCDLAAERGVLPDVAKLEAALGVPVVPTCGRTGQGRDELAAAVAGRARRGIVPDIAPLRAMEEAAAWCAAHGDGPCEGDVPFRRGAAAVARAMLSGADAAELAAALRASGKSDAAAAFDAARARLAEAGEDVVSGAAAARYAAIESLLAGASADGPSRNPSKSSARRAADRVLLHPVLGFAAMLAIFAAVFWAIFQGCEPLTGLVEDAMGALGDAAASLAGGDRPLLASFLKDGVVGGIGGFVVFAPQIAVFFLFLELLDDSGYLARAAFLLDKLMGRFGLPGRAFLPLLSGFACAIPGIMAARTISNWKDRLVTMAVLPLMSCSARMPVYLLLVATVWSGAAGWVKPVVVMSMFGVGIAAAILCAAVLRRTVLRGGRTPLMLELPPYRMPMVRAVLRNMARRTWSFVAGAGPIIFVLTIGLWFLLNFPRGVPHAEETERRAAAAEASGDAEAAGDLLRQAAGERREASWLGRAGKVIEPALQPAGFDWKMGVAILASFAAREVFVPTLGVIYAAGEVVDEEETGTLRERMQADRRADGTPVYSPATALALMVFYVIALQCMSTLAALRRETGGWRWPLALFAAYTVAAYVAAVAVHQVATNV